MTRIAALISGMACGGAERVLSTLINYWSSQEKYHVTLFIYTNEEFHYDIHKDIRIQQLSKNRETSSKINVIKNTYDIYKNLNTHLKTKEYSALLCFGRESNCIGILASIGLNIKTIICERASPFGPVTFTWRTLPKFLYKFSDYLVLQTKASENDFRKMFPFPKNLRFIKNPISPRSKSEKLDVNKQNIILSVGRLHKTKGHSHFIHALSKLKYWNNWNAIIIGDGEEKHNLQLLIKQLKLEDKVALLGSKKDVFPFYRKASLFVLSSESEGFPNVLIEAMTSKCACISYNCSYGPDEIIENDVSGILVKDQDYSELSAAIQSLILDSNKIIQLSENAAKSTEAYTVSNISNQWEEIIN